MTTPASFIFFFFYEVSRLGKFTWSNIRFVPSEVVCVREDEEWPLTESHDREGHGKLTKADTRGPAVAEL